MQTSPVDKKIESKIQTLIQEFSALPEWESRVQLLVEMGRQLPAFPKSYQTDQYRIKACLARVWLRTEPLATNPVRLQIWADSDSPLVKGLLAVLLKVYSKATCEEILETEPDFLNQLGFDSLLVPNRANGLPVLIKHIKKYAAETIRLRSSPV